MTPDPRAEVIEGFLDWWRLEGIVPAEYVGGNRIKGPQIVKDIPAYLSAHPLPAPAGGEDDGVRVALERLMAMAEKHELGFSYEEYECSECKTMPGEGINGHAEDCPIPALLAECRAALGLPSPARAKEGELHA